MCHRRGPWPVLEFCTNRLFILLIRYLALPPSRRRVRLPEPVFRAASFSSKQKHFSSLETYVFLLKLFRDSCPERKTTCAIRRLVDLTGDSSGRVSQRCTNIRPFVRRDIYTQAWPVRRVRIVVPWRLTSCRDYVVSCYRCDLLSVYMKTFATRRLVRFIRSRVVLSYDRRIRLYPVNGRPGHSLRPFK